ncbi:hypothetical protein ACFCZ3_20220 [Cellulosimicrobium cellulans]|uniref:hypothetical protein n=1 Tax=Cellulosimicrobium cellulans TaxID=1710 RepID=UPI0035E324F2
MPITIERPVRTPSQQHVTAAHEAVLAVTRLAAVTDYRLVFNERGVIASRFSEDADRVSLRVVDQGAGSAYLLSLMASDKEERRHLLETPDVDLAAAYLALIAHRHRAHLVRTAKQVHGVPGAKFHESVTHLAETWPGGVADFIAVTSP